MSMFFYLRAVKVHSYSNITIKTDKHKHTVVSIRVPGVFSKLLKFNIAFFFSISV